VRSIANIISESARHPSELDEFTESLGITPVLANPHLAGQVDLTDLAWAKAPPPNPDQQPARWPQVTFTFFTSAKRPWLACSQPATG